MIYFYTAHFIYRQYIRRQQFTFQCASWEKKKQKNKTSAPLCLEASQIGPSRGWVFNGALELNLFSLPKSSLRRDLITGREHLPREKSARY